MLDDTPSALGGPPAGFWRRFGAVVIDGIIVGIVNEVFSLILGKGAGYAIGFIVSAAYFTYFHGRTGQTPGDAALSIKVVDERAGTNQPIGYGRAFGRWVISIFSAIVIVIGYLWMLWDPKKQTWHDKAVGSLPVYLGR
ncbi:MAG TPA: RDD family protein [Gaiellaceae bacterium]|jgi:uncharacterized RDD family membrane protein YckC